MKDDEKKLIKPAQQAENILDDEEELDEGELEACAGGVDIVHGGTVEGAKETGRFRR